MPAMSEKGGTPDPHRETAGPGPADAEGARGSPSQAPAAADSGEPAFVSSQVSSARRFYLNLKPRREARLAVTCGGVETCAPDYTITRKSFPYLSIELVGSGSGELELHGKSHALTSGSVFTYGPGIEQHIRTSRTEPMVKYFVDFIGAGAERLLRETELAPGTFRSVSAVPEARAAFDALIDHGLKTDAYTARRCALQLELLVYSIAQRTQPPSSNERRARLTFERCLNFIDTSYLQVHSVDEIATACRIDSSHLCRLFRRFQKQSPYHYLQRLRMQWVADRLQNSNVLVQEIAAELRTDPYQLSRCFKRVHGVSPMAFLAARPGAASAR